MASPSPSPVRTTYGPPLGSMGDILGGGFLRSLASFVAATAALATGSPLPAARVEPGHDVLGDHRAGRAVRGVHSGIADRHRPALRPGVDRQAGASPRNVRGAL